MQRHLSACLKNMPTASPPAILLAALVLVLPQTGIAALVHRYDFNGTVHDSVGSSDGTLIDPQHIASFSNGLLNLDNPVVNSAMPSTGAYVDLPNGMISSLGRQATFEMWITMNSTRLRQFAEMWSFGTSDGGEDNPTVAGNSRYITMIPLADATLRFTHRSAGPPGGAYAEHWIDAASALSTGVEHQVVGVWDEIDTTDGPDGTATLYLDGALVGHVAIRAGITLASLNDVNNWLGRSQWGNDPLIDAKYDDFRIFDSALSAQDVLADFQAGPDVVAVPEPSVALVLTPLALLSLRRRRR